MTALITTDLQEIWKPVPNWGMYHVSNLGRVKRISGPSSIGRKLKEKILKTSNRYITLFDLPRSQHFPVAGLVLLAFKGPPPKDKPLATHKNDDWKDNKLTNISWGSKRSNAFDAIRNGKRIYKKGVFNHTEKAKARIGKSSSERQKGIPKNPISVEKMRQTKTGVPLSDAHRAAISKALIKSYREGRR